MQHEHEHAAEPHAEASVRGHSVAEEVEVEVELFGVEAFVASLLDEHLDAVFALRSGGDFDAVEDEVVAVGEVRIAVVTHVVERANTGGVVGEEDEFVPERFEGVGRDLAFAFRVHVIVGARHFVAAVGDDALSLGQRDARERQRGYRNFDAEEGFDLGTVLVFDGLEAGNEELFVQFHDVFVAVDPADFGVDAGEFGGVTAGEAGVCAEGRADLEDFSEAGGLRHLLEELGALGEVGLGVEVVNLK